MFLQLCPCLVYILRSDIRVEGTLEDIELSSNLLDKINRRALKITLRHLVGSTSHHLLTKWAKVWAGGVIVHHQVSHATNRSSRPNDIRSIMRDQIPGTVSSIGRAGHPNFHGLCQSGVKQSLCSCGNIHLLAPTPAILSDGKAILQAEARAAAVIHIQHIKATVDIILDGWIYPILAMPGWTTMYKDDSLF